MMAHLNNPYFSEMRKTGEIKTFGLPQLHAILRRVKHKNMPEARSLVILLYYLGLKTSEMLSLLSSDFEISSQYIKVNIKQKTTLMFKNEGDLREVAEYIKNKPPYFVLFHDFISNYKKTVKLKSGEVKTYITKSKKVHDCIKKWSKAAGYDLIPIWFMHNRLRKLGKVTTVQEFLYWTGRKSIRSVERYMHDDNKNTEELKKLSVKVK